MGSKRIAMVSVTRDAQRTYPLYLDLDHGSNDSSTLSAIAANMRSPSCSSDSDSDCECSDSDSYRHCSHTETDTDAGSVDSLFTHRDVDSDDAQFEIDIDGSSSETETDDDDDGLKRFFAVAKAQKAQRRAFEVICEKTEMKVGRGRGTVRRRERRRERLRICVNGREIGDVEGHAAEQQIAEDEWYEEEEDEIFYDPKFLGIDPYADEEE